MEKKNKKKLLTQSIKSLKKIENQKVLIIGDAIIDQYDSVNPLNKPIKESILATRYLKTDIFLGGVFGISLRNYLIIFRICKFNGLGGPNPRKNSSDSCTRRNNSDC